MKDEIPDDKMTASSVLGGHEAKECKMDSGRAWCASTRDEKRNEYLQIDFGKTMRVTAVVTKGRKNHNSWTKSYSLNSTFDLITWDVIESNGEKVFR